MTAAPSNRHIFLTGYRGSGKSTVAKRVSSRLGLKCFDTDVLVESNAGKRIADIFIGEGEQAFRDWETQVLSELVRRPTPIIISLGGGAILRKENRQMILSSGWCAWLKASPQELARRISLDAATSSSRPPLSRLGVLGEIESILRERQPLYEEVANEQYETESINLESLVDHITIDYNTWLDEIPS